MAGVAQADSIFRHLEEVLASETFRRASTQAQVLRALVQASLESREPSARELVQAVYGKDTESYQHALRQAVYALRGSLERYYGSLQTPQTVRFELAERGYTLRIIQHSDSSGNVRRLRSVAPQARLFRWPVLGALGLAALAVPSAAIWQLSRPEPIPARIEIRGGLPTLLDGNGREVAWWAQVLGVKSPLDLEPPGHEHRGWPELGERSVPAAVLDSQAGGDTPSVVLAKVTPMKPGESRLLLLDGRSGKTIASIGLPYFPNSPTPQTLHFSEEEGGEWASHPHVGAMGLRDFDGDNRHDDLLLSLLLPPLYPTQILALSMDQSLRVRRNYWTDGNIEVVLVEDLDGDGKAELVLRGTNNDFQQAMLVILRLDEPDGRTPEKGRRPVFREIQDLPQNGLVILFPRTPVGLDPALHTPRAWVRSISGRPGSKGFLVMVDDVSPSPQQPGETQWKIQFDLSPNREEIGVTFLDYDFYLAHMKKLIGAGTIKDRWRILETDTLDEYGRDLSLQVMYWDGSEPKPEWRQLTTEKLKEVLSR